MPHDDSYDRSRRRGRAAGTIPLIGCLWLAGCGVQAYEQRLNDANELFTYQNRLDQVLTRQTWGSPDGSVSFRVPLNYTLIPGPPPVTGDEENAEPVADPRQPTYLGVPEIEGLVSAWKTTVAADSGAATVYLYLLGNQDRILNSGPGKVGAPPEDYLKDLESVLQMQLGITLTEGQSGNDVNVKRQESIPREERFVRRKDFAVARLVPPPEALRNLGLPEGVELEAYLYEHRADPIQIAFLLVAPPKIRDNPEAALRVALETLSVQPPRRAASGEAAPAGNTGF
ncbi:MAG: hypothetical protein JNG89_19655 [Planctomycetaceae bacterium]|nr:hypothetical protein [Planctomycetaceae bacterium]